MIRNVKRKTYLSNTKLFSFGLACITLAITPSLNEDAITIPKLILFSLLVTNLLPFLILNLKSIFVSRTDRIILLFSFFMLVQSVSVLILSEAPFEQKFFGRPYRLMGFVTFVFIILLFLISYTLFNANNYENLINALVVTGFISSIYAIFQYFGYDFVQWRNTSTLAAGPMGLTNFQSAFSAITIVPTIYFIYKRFKDRKILIFYMLVFIVFYLVTIYFTASLQGFIGVVIGLSTLLFIFLLYHHRNTGLAMLVICLYPFVLTLGGVLGSGPLAKYLYKDSVQSRGDFWRSALKMSNEHPFYGVGFDTFPDYYFRYKDQKTANRSWYENTDSAHNFYLDISSQAGYPSALLFLALALLVIYSFIRYLINTKIFDFKIVTLFCAWIVMQATSLINPINIPLFAWNVAFSGVLLRITRPDTQANGSKKDLNRLKAISLLSPIRLFSSLLTLIVILPIHLSDQSYLLAKKNLEVGKMISIANSFPRSSHKFQDLSTNLLLKKDYTLALEVARSATKFNPNNAAAWALILINPAASIEERTSARREVFRIDPLNGQFKDYTIRELE
jgi:O-antigen ligase